MNPRFRRLLIPGLLVALLVVVLVGALTGRSDGAVPPREAAAPGEATLVSRIDDPRITESSGLAVSTVHDDLAYTINDSGNAAVIFAIRISTGQVVGTTRIDGATWLDTEAMALRDGTLWVADTGDNAGGRSDAALYELPEPGPGNDTATPTRYLVTYDRGPQNVEAMVAIPDSGEVMLFSKGPAGGSVLQLPEPLKVNAPNIATTTDRSVPAFTTDATVTADGRQVLVRNYAVAQVRDVETWELLRTDAMPDQPQGETIAMEPSGASYLVGSEGTSSALFRLAFDPDADDATAAPTSGAPSTPVGDATESTDVRIAVPVLVGVGVLVAVLTAVLLVRRDSHTE